jgi:hypothetical protein
VSSEKENLMTIKQRTTRGLALAAVTGTTIAVGGLVAAAAVPPAAGAAQARSQTVRLEGTPTGFKAVDIAPKGDSMGDQNIDTFSLRKGSSRYGTGVQVCVLASPSAGTAQCNATLLLPRGEIVLDGAVTGARVTRMPIVGGSGKYRGSGGVAVFTPHGQTITVDLHLRGLR